MTFQKIAYLPSLLFSGINMSYRAKIYIKNKSFFAFCVLTNHKIYVKIISVKEMTKQKK